MSSSKILAGVHALLDTLGKLPTAFAGVVLIVAAIPASHEMIVIAPFNFPPGTSLPFGEYTTANVIADTWREFPAELEKQLVRHVEQSNIYLGKGYGPQDFDSSGSCDSSDSANSERLDASINLQLGEKAFDPASMVDIADRYSVEIKGVSFESLVSFMRKVFGREHLVRGDVVIQDGKMRLLGRTEGKLFQSSWNSASIEGLRLSASDLVNQATEILHPSNFYAHEIALGKHQETYERIRDLLKLAPRRNTDLSQSFTLATYLWSNDLIRAGDLQKALSVVRDARALVPGNPVLEAALVTALIKSNNKSAYREILSLTREQPTHAPAFNAMAILSLRHGYYHDAAEYFQKAVSLEPSLAMYHRNLTLAYIDGNDPRAAILEINRVISMGPIDSENYNIRAAVKFMQGDLSGAIADLKHAIDITPDDPTLYLRLGDIELKLRNLSAAANNYRAAIHFAPNFSSAYSSLAFVRVTQDPADALAEARRALSINPKNCAAWKVMSMAYVKLHRTDEGIRTLLASLRKNPNDDGAYGGLCALYASSGQYEKAKFYCQIQARRWPGNPESYNNLGWIAMKESRTDDAVRYFRKALSLDSNSDSANSKLGLIYASRHEYLRALYFFKKSFEVNPQAPGFDELRALLLRCAAGELSAQKELKRLFGRLQESNEVRVAP